MTTRSSSSSSSSESEVTSGRVREISETSRDTSHAESRRRLESPTNTIDGTSLAETTTVRSVRSVRSSSPVTSHTSGSASAGRTGYDTVSLATTTNTGVTNVTAPSQSSTVVGGIPIIRPPVVKNQQSGTGIGVFGPQRAGSYPPKPPTPGVGLVHQRPIQIDVAAAQNQYQQRAVQPGVSPYSGSTSSSAGSLSSPGGVSVQRPPLPPPQQQYQQHHFDAATATFAQADLNRNDSISREEFRQWAPTGTNQAAGYYEQQQQQQQQQLHAQFPNQIPANQVINELLGPDAFKDVILDIDYGAMGGFNAAFQSGSDFFGGQLPPGINVRPAYTPVDSLNYQQHMFNTARTIDANGASSNYNFEGQHFDAAKAIFNQVDANHDGSINRDEFRQWAQSGQENYGGQTYSTAANYQTSYNATGGAGVNNNFYQANLFDGVDPSVANILQQSGLGQVVPN